MISSDWIKLNYMKKFEEKRISLSSVKYIGEYRNEFVTLDNRGLLPSISRLMNFGGKASAKNYNDLNEKIGKQAQESKEEEKTEE